MSGEAWLYLFAVIINAVNLFLQVFFTIMYSDLECLEGAAWGAICARVLARAVMQGWWDGDVDLSVRRVVLTVCVLLRFSDYINPIDLCNRLNTYIVPEAAVHAFLTILFLVNGYWIPLLLNIPLLAFNAKK
ncbi:hypothetical protein GP486_003367 [Trichoglossum hirsutum]|uniref:Uncharacterized protein n=1 Tax=Trichoglossum hirsutum TaxID=265104 RepID=A0A9P8LD68_9PEZI|nr:hypothetical protein GP486_003367 [Trichoglossum hirsutum]